MNQLTLQQDQRLQRFYERMSVVVSSIYMLGVVGSMFATQAWASHLDRAAMAAHQPLGFTNSYKLASVVLSAQVQVLDRVWNFIVANLVRAEQHVTMFDFNQSLAAKSMVMKFITSFSPLFLIA